MESYCMNQRNQSNRKMYNTNTVCKTNTCVKNTDCMLSDLGLSHLPLAMGYVPYQEMKNMYDCSKGLEMGTMFPELCKPFCGTGGNRKC